eukprot:TRINITY_DN988_c0_g1_i3.p1 TRINITY_DN988_c0_g1~~TRINITY_DN988_c0_g1_i3.p1  ORF type:complete len:313 (+),score=41.12 TRINITY_DN988_c0_g1_i3:89-1027(+)
MEGATSIHSLSAPIDMSLPCNEFHFSVTGLNEGFNKTITEKLPKMLTPGTRVGLILTWSEYKCSIKDHFSKLAEEVSQITNLSELVLDVTSTNLSDEDCIVISDVLQASQSVSKLHLLLNSTTIADQGLKQIVQRLSCLTHLNEMTIVIKACQNVGERGFNDLLEAIESLPKMINLALSFKKCSAFSDKTASKLSAVLANFSSSLSNLLLDFTKTQITDDGLLEVSKSITTLKQLDCLFIFLENLNITDKAICHLAEATSALSKINNLCIYCKSCKELTDQSAQAIFDLLQKRTLITILKGNLQRLPFSIKI